MKFRKSLVGISVASALLAMSGNAAASAFALIEQSSGLGNAFAGGAAAAEDATTIFFNPAGMSKLKGKQVTVAGSFIKPSATFSDTGTTTATGQTAAVHGKGLGGNGGDAGSLALVPNTYVVTEIEPALRFGLGINAPFGLKTDYDPTWAGRYQAIKSQLQTININPSLAYQMNDSVSLGFGVNYQHISGDLTSAANYAGGVYGGVYAKVISLGGTPAAAAAAAGAAANAVNTAGQGEGLTTLSGSDSKWGYNFGMLFNLNEQTRIGVAYRSKISYTLKGTVAFSNNRPSAATLTPVLGGANATSTAATVAARTADGDINLPINMPATFSVSGFHNSDGKWDFMADATWTGWGQFKELKVDYANGTNLMTTPENWKNTWRFAAGSSYHYNEQWLARVGVAYDQSPVPDAYRTARIPDNNRTWLAFGGQYKLSQAGKIDFGYAHLFVKDTTIADNQAATGKSNLVGTYSNSVDILSVQYAYNF
jgi:long-chain fatty acid transport protein